MNKKTHQVWSWNSIQRSTDSLMNKAYIFSCKRLVEKSLPKSDHIKILDVGAGSGLVLRHIHSHFKSPFSYLGIDLNTDGLDKLKTRAEKLGIKSQVETEQSDISIFNKNWDEHFDLIFSNFCLYTIKEKNKRLSALQNIARYMKNGGKFFIALPSENYSALGIATQCFRDEFSDKQKIFDKFVRMFVLVPYQWKFVLQPIEKKVNDGDFLRFNEASIREEFKEAGLEIINIDLDYGNCGYHISGTKK